MNDGKAAPAAIRLFALVRDKEGRPRFDQDPRTLPEAEQAAFKSLMTEAEIQEFFG